MAQTKNQSTPTKKRGRPPKNVIGGKTKSGRGRPPKNVIKPRKSKTSTTKKATKKPQKIRRNITKNTKKSKGFTTHKVNATGKKENNFAFWLLMGSIILFGFSIYKAFFQQHITTPLPQVTDTINPTQYVTDTTIVPTLEEVDIIVETTGMTTNYQTGDEIASTETTLQEDNEKEITLFTLPIFVFSKAFIREEQDKDIEILQKLLHNESVYTGEINGIYDDETLNAVYQFQLKYEILDENSNKTLHGFFGPGTRTKANELMPK